MGHKPSEWELKKLKWATKAYMYWDTFKSYVLFWVGLYTPLWMINYIVYGYEMHKLEKENDDGDKIVLEFYSIEQNLILYENDCDTIETHRDLTARMVWFLYFIGDAYDECMDYSIRSLPWFDLHRRRFKHSPINNITFRYHIWENTPMKKITLERLIP